MPASPTILFDGVCNLCNNAVKFTIKRDKKGIIKFAPLQSETGQKLMLKYNLPIIEMQSFIFIENGKAYNRSTAALRVCRYLSWLWPMCYGLIIVPKFIRDGIYNWIAKNRYKWFGQKDTCMVPTPDIRASFLN